MKNAARMGMMILGLGLVLGMADAPFAIGQDKKDDKKATPKPAAAASFELYKDSGGKFRFRLKDEEGNIICMASRGYEEKEDCQKVIDAVKKLAAKAKVNDVAK